MLGRGVHLPEIRSREFWNLYDKFCRPSHLRIFIKNGESNLSHQMCAVMKSAHLSRVIHRISRPEQGWQNHKAWLALRNAPIQNDKGEMIIFMRAGDVIVVEFGWNHDVIITHNPIPRNIVSDYLLSGRWEEMVGLFMPLFDKKTIDRCIRSRIAKNMKEALSMAEEEAKDWQWY